MIKNSFVIIAYNEEDNIERAIRSIEKQNNLESYEIIVVNDGSKDDTIGVVKRLAVNNKNISIVDLQPNQGRGAARAAGIKAAKGSYLALVDADITLPEDWLATCYKYMPKYDACGGTAVPDGDVSYVHRVCNLVPKAVAHTTTVTGSNGLFKKTVFEKISFDPNRRNGEDVDLGFKIAQHNIKTTTIPGLLVEHLETKTYKESISWLFESGIGASRQFYEHPRIRLPDMAYAAFVVVSVTSLSLVVTQLLPGWIALAAIAGILITSSAMHLRGKFHLSHTVAKSGVAIIINASILLSYYIGRTVGVVTTWRKYDSK